MKSISNKKPPKAFLGFFKWFCHPDLHPYIEGDLLELYKERIKEKGQRKADWLFIIDVILLFRPGIIGWTKSYQNTFHFAIYKNYLKTGWRSLIRNKVFSSINIAGLSLGLTCSILIALWVIDEYGIDSFHAELDRIFVVTSREYSGSEVNGSYDTPGLLGEELKNVLPEIEYSCNYAWTQYHTFAVEEKKVKIQGNFAGSDFFNILSFPLVLGTKETALKSPESIAISRKMAENLFGSPELAMDKTLLFENYKNLKVTAIFEDIQDNSSEKFEYLINWDFFVERNNWVKVWHNSGPYTFIKLHEHANEEIVSSKIQHFIKQYDNEYSDLDRLELGLQPFREKYLHNTFKNGYISGGRIEYVILFQWVAIFILLIACINFMNLSTARSLKRAKEIGVRKVTGAIKSSLITQFLVEAFLFNAIAVAMAIILLQLLLPQFNLLTGKNIHSPISDGRFWIGIITLTAGTAIISGSYPAFLMSSFKPISVLKNNIIFNSSSVFLRKGLVVFQFALSMIFIVGMIVVTRQVDFIQNKNLGYEKENLIYLPITGEIAENFDLFKYEVLQTTSITSVSKISQRPVQIENTTGSVEWEGKDPNTLPTFTQARVGYDFVKTMQATMVLGRDFSREYSDSAKYIINETALKIIGYDNPIGMPLTFWDTEGTIIGVVKDFHFNSLHVTIKPLILRLNSGKGWGTALIRVQPGKTPEALTDLEKIHKKLNPDFPFAHQFADEEYGFLYEREQVIKQLSRYFAALAIFICCLGLLGLIIFTAEQRTKEVGIRKVLGANILQLVAILSKDFIVLVVLSVIVASPIAYFIMNTWLQGYEYHINVHIWMFGIAALGAIALALLTISYQAIKTAIMNPVHSLRNE